MTREAWTSAAALTQYDPFDGDRLEREEEEQRLFEARRVHERWSQEQAKAGQPALSRTPLLDI